MSAIELVNKCHEAGVRLHWNGSKITAYGDKSIISQLLPTLRNHKEELNAFFVAEAMEYYNERAGIMEFEGELSRAEAEAQSAAELQTRQQKIIH